MPYFLLTRIVVERHIISDRCSHSVCTCGKRQVGSGHGGAGYLWLLLASKVDGRGSMESGAVHVGRVAVGRWLERQRVAQVKSDVNVTMNTAHFIVAPALHSPHQ